MRFLIALLLLSACADPVIHKPVIDEEPVTVTTTMPAHAEEHDREMRPCCVDSVPAQEASYDILPSAVERGAARRRWTGRVQISRNVLWNVPDETGPEATITGLLRIAGTEVEWQSERDLIGIWQVTQTVRASHCDRERIPEITECVDGEETHLSAMRRLSRHAMGVVPPSRVRQEWIRIVEQSCEEPEGFPARRNWGERRRRNRSSLQESCQAAAQLARGLVTGSVQRRVTGPATPIAWGGRCEVNGGACDDRLACQRGLARIPNTRTSNALWCRVGSRGCPAPVVRDGIVYSDEVCAGLNIPAPERVQRHARDEEPEHEDDDPDRLG